MYGNELDRLQHSIRISGDELEGHGEDYTQHGTLQLDAEELAHLEQDFSKIGEGGYEDVHPLPSSSVNNPFYAKKRHVHNSSPIRKSLMSPPDSGGGENKLLPR